MLCHAMPCYATLRYATLCYAMLCYAMLRYATLCLQYDETATLIILHNLTYPPPTHLQYDEETSVPSGARLVAKRRSFGSVSGHVIAPAGHRMYSRYVLMLRPLLLGGRHLNWIELSLIVGAGKSVT